MTWGRETGPNVDASSLSVRENGLEARHAHGVLALGRDAVFPLEELLRSRSRLAHEGQALLAARLMSSLLFNVSSVDPLTYAAVSIGLIVTAVLASYLPSRRAAAVDPSEALRSE